MNDVKQGTTNKINTVDLVLTGLFTAVICIMSQIAIPIQPIPFTLSLLSIFLTGALLQPRYALLSVLAYILLGAFGVPVFAGLKGGFQVLTGYTGGYLMAYPLMAFVTAMLYKYIKKNKLLGLIAGMLLSLLLCYIIGTIWFTIVSGNDFITALTLCVVPFVLFDLLKIILAISISTVIRKALSRNNILSN
jgi:biotin transport system substrate-specific component